MLIRDGDLDSAASRLYYAMFFVAESLLGAKGLSFSSHKAVISAFGLHFAKTNELDPRFHQHLIAAFNQRQLGDYAIDSGLTVEDIAISIEAAEVFIQAGQMWLDKHRLK
jgi:uncharacterized protein (UPF0332 family)